MANKRTPPERDIAFIALALNGGNVKRTAEEIGMPESTLNDWAHRYADRYAQVQNDQAPAIAERVASKSEALALQAIEVEQALLAKAMQGVEDMKGTDAAAAFRNISTGKALQFDKLSNPIRGRNHVRVDERDLDTILNSLARRYQLEHVVNTTATEIPDAEIAPDIALPGDVASVNARALEAGEPS